MRIFSMVILTLLCAIFTFAQKSVSKTVKTETGQVVNFDFERANVKFTTWNKNEISITGTAQISRGENDEAFQIEAKQRNGEWNIETYLENECDLPKFITMSKNGVKSYKKMDKKNKNWNAWEYTDDDGEHYDNVNIGILAEIELEIKVPQNIELVIKSKFGNIDVQDFEGALYAKNTHGHLDVVFSKRPKNNVTLISTHSFVDVSVPKNSELNVELKTSHGELLTDLDLNFEQGNGGRNGKNSCGGKNTVVANYNGGGSDLFLKSTHNKVYLREFKMNN